MKKAIIVDDEQLAIDTLSWQIKEFCSGIDIIETFTNPVDALNYLSSHKIDLCFLDIDMPEMTGFELLEKLPQRNFDVVFATAYNEYAIKAFKVSAFDYLLKPIDEDELVSTIEKYNNISSNQSISSEQLELLTTQLSNGNAYNDRIALSTQEGLHLLDIEEIVRLESFKNYTTVYTINRTPIVVSKTLKDVEKALDPSRFFRVHQSHTVDLKKIQLYVKGSGGSLKLKNGDSVPVSKHRKDALLNLL